MPNQSYPKVISGNIFWALNHAGSYAVLLAGARERATIGGTATPGDAVALTVTSTVVAGSPLTVTYAVVPGDTTTTIAAGLAALINGSTALANAGITATSAGPVVTVAQSRTLFAPFAAAPVWASNVTGCRDRDGGAVGVAVGATGATIANNQQAATSVPFGIEGAPPGANGWLFNVNNSALDSIYQSTAGDLVLHGDPNRGVRLANAMTPTIDNAIQIGTASLRLISIFSVNTQFNNLTCLGGINEQGMGSIAHSHRANRHDWQRRFNATPHQSDRPGEPDRQTPGYPDERGTAHGQHSGRDHRVDGAGQRGRDGRDHISTSHVGLGRSVHGTVEHRRRAMVVPCRGVMKTWTRLTG